MGKDNEKGVVIWEGKSYYNDEDIVVIATFNTDNRKTGKVIQTWILNANVDPINAKKEGKDKCICGECSIKDNCYSSTFLGPNNIYKCYKENKYSRDLSILESDKYKDIPIRLGAYGDMALVPLDVIKKICNGRKNKGYTHTWDILYRFKSEEYIDELKNYFMASTISEEENNRAQQLGWKTFRIRKNESDPVLSNEIVCPASLENSKVQCVKCNFCCGNESKNICIIDHGPKSELRKEKRKTHLMKL